MNPSDTRALEAHPKLCRDCKWMREPGTMAKCDAPSNRRPQPILTGFEPEGHLHYWVFCDNARTAASNACGEEGEWWEAAE